MIADFDDFVTWMYVLIDAIWQPLAPLYQRPGPQPECCDSELITMAVVGECREWDKETNVMGEWDTYRHLFPMQPERSRFNRRRRNLAGAINHIRQMVLAVLDVAQDHQCVIDSLPIEVVQFHLVPASTGDWAAYGATFGPCPTKKRTIYGYRLHLLITVGGTILDVELTSANADTRDAARDLLLDKRDRTVIGDKGCISAPRAAELLAQANIRLLTLKRRNQHEQVSPEVRPVINQIRQIIETVNGQLTEQFGIETNHAHSFWGVCARLYTKLTAHTLCIYLNRLLGNPEWLRIKALAFPT
ncbi:MAG: IS982 family transposase [Chloroflexota bacterium]|nr:IS982 family transposase [Chloroflexota bacterium]